MELKYIQGIKYTAVEALSRIPTRSQPEQECLTFSDKISKNNEDFTLKLNHIVAEQNNSTDLIKRLQSNIYIHQAHLRNDRCLMYR